MCRRSLSLLLGALALAASGSAEADVRIGLATPLTGPYALSGARSRIAVEMAVRDLNQNGGVLGEAAELVIVDDACGLQQALAAARRLVESGVDVVVGHLCSHSSLLAAGIYETADVLMISPASTHPRLTEEGRQNVFRLTGRDDHQGALAGDFLAERWAGAEIAIVHDGSTYGEGLAIEARKRLRARGIEAAIYERYQPNQEDYAALAARLQAAAVEVLYIGGYGPDAGRILRAVRAAGDDLQLIGGDGLGMDEFWTIAGRLGAGTVFSSRRNPATLPAAADVLAGFRARGLGARSGGLAYYAAVQAWAQAVERVGTVEPAEVAGMLRRGRFETVLGPVAFDRKGDLDGATWQWQVWADGIYLPVLDPDRADLRSPPSRAKAMPGTRSERHSAGRAPDLG